MEPWILGPTDHIELHPDPTRIQDPTQIPGSDPRIQAGPRIWGGGAFPGPKIAHFGVFWRPHFGPKKASLNTMGFWGVDKTPKKGHFRGTPGL